MVVKVNIRLAKKSDLEKYTDLLQRTYQATYTNTEIGLNKECFSKEIFATRRVQDYLKENLAQSNKQKAWLAFSGKQLIGSITVTDMGKECELIGFYVSPKHQGKGIGKKLWRKALSFAKDKDLVLDLYTHSHKTISMYKKWGFRIDEQKGFFYRHWPEWPKGLKAKCVYMRLSIK